MENLDYFFFCGCVISLVLALCGSMLVFNFRYGSIGYYQCIGASAFFSVLSVGLGWLSILASHQY